MHIYKTKSILSLFKKPQQSVSPCGIVWFYLLIYFTYSIRTTYSNRTTT